MDCKVEAAVLRKAGHEGDTAVLTPAHGGWHHQQCPPPSSTAAQEGEPYCAACTDQGGGLLWELDFSVDDLLDLGGDVDGEEQHGAEGEELLLRDGEVEGEGEESGGTGWCNSINTSSTTTTTSATVALLPSGSDLVVVPAGDVEDLEWVSRFVDDSYSEFAAAAAAHAPPFANLHAPAPAPPVSAVAVETGANTKASSTSSGTPLKRSWHSCSFSSTASVAVPAKARSKRPRAGGPRVWSLRRTSFLCESSSSSCSSVSSSSSCSVFSSVTSSLGDGGGYPGRLLLGTPRLGQCLPQAVKKKKGRKPKVIIVPAATAPEAGGGNGGDAEQQARRRCSHCGVDKTPQWRAGPMGAKTLCNACGVRYKSGRLLPEYRPAGSPTFLSHVHSNSHRKVMEIRRSKEPVAAAGSPAASCLASPPQQPAGPTRPYGVV